MVVVRRRSKTSTTRSGRRRLAELQNDDTWYWIDVLCVDRRYTAKCDHEVGVMAEIFSLAAQVVT